MVMATTKEQRDAHIRADRTEIERWQLAALEKQLAAILPDNEFYRAKLVDVSRPIASLPDIRELPFTTKRELVPASDDDDLIRTLTFPKERYWRRHQTSGTHGRPLVLLDRREDWSWWLECWQYVLDAAAITEADHVFAAFSFGPFIGFWTAFEAAAARGALVVPGGGMSTAARIKTIMRADVTAIFCTPSYALHLAEVAESEGTSLAKSAVRALIVAGEPGGSVPNVRQRIEHAFDATVFDHGGATEVGAWGFPDPERTGLLVNEREFIAEFISPESGSPAGDGELSELVLTNLGRYGAPVIRYRTGDLVRPTWRDAERNGFALLEGGILGRADEMAIVRGVNVFPSAVDEIVRAFSEIAEYRTTVAKAGQMDQLTVEIEPTASSNPSPEASNSSAMDNLVTRVSEAFRVHLGLRVDIRTVDPGTLPRYEAKARRFTDARKK